MGSLREVFEQDDERLLTYIPVSRPGKKTKAKSLFLCVVGSWSVSDEFNSSNLMTMMMNGTRAEVEL